MQTLNIGHNATVVSGKVLAILPCNSAPCVIGEVANLYNIFGPFSYSLTFARRYGYPFNSFELMTPQTRQTPSPPCLPRLWNRVGKFQKSMG